MVHTINAKAHGGSKAPINSVRSPCGAAEVPLHITGIWIPFFHPDPRLAGSLGAGLLLDPLVYVRVCKKPQGKSIHLEIAGEIHHVAPEPLARILEEVEPGVAVYAKSPVPLAVGYAISAALTLGFMLAFSLVNPILSFDEAALKAHIAEVISGTGLGDVVAQYYGRGLELRVAPGGPGYGRVASFPTRPYPVVTAVVRRGYTTSEMHRVLGEKLVKEAAVYYKLVYESPTLENFLQAASEFTVRLGVISGTDVEFVRSLERRGYIVGWYAKKGVIVLVAEPDRDSDVFDAVKAMYREAYRHRVSAKPAGASYEDPPDTPEVP